MESKELITGWEGEVNFFPHLMSSSVRSSVNHHRHWKEKKMGGVE